ncbi:ABC transporter permease [Nitrosococcus watsonii]|uniref:ABC-2 type transporter n=1 Tax=Nitrosococcus watsoni (strain C-113) TaxID=105559 RepID=D8K5S8_NITWC|nr:ABC transporter permease [Nitrosococcus watsonii]ADJ28255.1 ABC-2 type transporter [Nitrosococcus watsonii C-113]
MPQSPITPSHPPPYLRLQRLRGLVIKETRQILRDPSSTGIAFVLPAILLLLFGYGVSLDAKHVQIALVVEQPTDTTARFTAFFISSEYFRPLFLPQRQAAEKALLAGEVRGMVVLRENFAKQIHQQAGAPIQVIVDGADANTGRQILGYVRRVWQDWLVLEARHQGLTFQQPVHQEFRIWFNPEVRSQNFLVPGLMAIIMTLTGALLTSLLVAREYDRGTIESLMVTPVTPNELLLGKLIPTFILGMGGMVLSFTLGVGLFEVPFRGSLWVLFLTAALFMLATLGMGLLISTLAKDQFVAGQIAIMVTFLPAFLLSGFIFNLASAPTWIQAVSYLIAARYFIEILKTLFLVGNIWNVIIPNGIALFLMAGVLLILSRVLTRKRLD